METTNMADGKAMILLLSGLSEGGELSSVGGEHFQVDGKGFSKEDNKNK